MTVDTPALPLPRTSSAPSRALTATPPAIATTAPPPVRAGRKVHARPTGRPVDGGAVTMPLPPPLAPTVADLAWLAQSPSRTERVLTIAGASMLALSAACAAVLALLY